ncbi:hypothetical protein GQ44DRAFT_736036 [Phaeosphaeriaceae sp. PMI808]|nr:hypothetical protein GQ44DRAFT_736036 [Phaeosphaeriaceae sp. PMI808]
MATQTQEMGNSNGVAQVERKRTKLHGRAFYESIGSPKLVLAPMVEQSEFAWRMLSRSFLPPDQQKSLLAYTPMFHSKMFGDKSNYRDAHFQPLKSPIPSPPDYYHISQLPDSDRHLDGNPAFDRPLTVQFCSNNPDDLLNAAKHVAPFCDAVDLNLGCPQGIAKRGKYGAFLQEDPNLIASMIRKLDKELDIPVTAKMRVLETKEKTLEYAQTILNAGASIITVHGRRREQKGHNTGLADWTMIRHLRENLPKDTVIFANGNILQHDDIAACLEATGADAVMSAEGNLYDPTIFAPPLPLDTPNPEYWRDRHGKGGYRVDAVMRRYLDIIHIHALNHPPPTQAATSDTDDDDGPPKKKQKQTPNTGGKKVKITNPNLTAMQAHLFHLLRPLVARHHNVRDALARARTGDIDAFEHVLRLVEGAVKSGISAYMKETNTTQGSEEEAIDPCESSAAAVERCRREYWVVQAYVRPVPREAIEKGSMTVGKKEMKRKGVEREKGEGGVVGCGKDSGVVEVEKEELVCG